MNRRGFAIPGAVSLAGGILVIMAMGAWVRTGPGANPNPKTAAELQAEVAACRAAGQPIPEDLKFEDATDRHGFRRLR